MLYYLQNSNDYKYKFNKNLLHCSVKIRSRVFYIQFQIHEQNNCGVQQEFQIQSRSWFYVSKSVSLSFFSRPGYIS